MDPFRDELAAAHAKIAELEERVRVHERPLPLQPTARKARSSVPYILIAIVVLVGLGALTLGGALFVLRSHSAARADDFKGIATAQLPPTSTAISPTIDTRPVASSSAKPKSSKPPCNCSPGDPLCTCL